MTTTAFPNVRPSALDPQAAPSAARAILFVDHTAKMGGGEVALLNLVANLDRSRYRPVVMLFEEGPLAERLRERGVEVRVLPLGAAVMETRKDSLGPSGLLKPGRLIGSVAHAARVTRTIRAMRPALVHTNSLKADLIGGLAARLALTPVVWHVRDRIADDYLPAKAVRLFRWLAGWLPTHVIANSAATLRTLTACPKPHRRAVCVSNATVVHDGIEVDAPAPARPLHARPVVGLIGRITPWKGQDVFIRAAAKVRAAGLECEYRIIGAPLFGEEAFEQELRALAEREGVADCVRFCGFKTDVPAEIAALDCVVHASTVPEPFGQVIVEGMAASKPVIATRAGGPVEIVDDGRTGLLVTPGDADALAAAIERVARDPALGESLGRAGREAVLDRFTIGRVARDVESLYDRLLRARR